MNQRVPVNPGSVAWSGENPGIYLKDDPGGPWSGLGIFFRVVLSPHGRGHTMIVLDRPDAALGYPESNNLCLSDNPPLTRYLIENYVSKFPSFRDQPGMRGMTHLKMDATVFDGDMKARYREVARSGDIEVEMRWAGLGEPFAVEVDPRNSATRAHDMYSVFLEAEDAGISVNGRPFSGTVTDREFLGRTMSTAFLALSEIWVSPDNACGPVMPLDRPIHPGTVVWTGENPGILLKEDPDGPLSAVALFFRIFYSPAGRGTALLLYQQPDTPRSLPDAVNVMLTDNRPMAEYLMRSFIGKLPAFTALPAFASTGYLDITAARAEGDPRDCYREIVDADGVHVELIWDELGTPTALELPAELTGPKENDMYTLLVESRDATILVNGTALPGRPFPRVQAGIRTTSAFLYFSETWISPA